MAWTQFPHEDAVEDDANLTAQNFSVEARWLRLLAQVQLHFIRHSARPGGSPSGCQLCRVYRADFWD